jgi:S-adenosylmethionine-diacylgycerolhomoserine-N-methlytransferase
MIPDWNQALRAAGESLSDKGRLHVVDFGDLTGLGPVAAGLLRRWLALFHVEPRVEILRALEADAKRNGASKAALRLLPARYAFLWTATKVEAESWAINHVAVQSQRAGNSPGLPAARAGLVDMAPQHPSE